MTLQDLTESRGQMKMHFFVDIAGPMEVHDAHDAYLRLLLRFGIHRIGVSRCRVRIFAAAASARCADGNCSNDTGPDTDSSPGCSSAVGHCRGARASTASAHGDKPSRAAAAAAATSRARAAQGGSKNQQRRSGIL